MAQMSLAGQPLLPMDCRRRWKFWESAIDLRAKSLQERELSIDLEFIYSRASVHCSSRVARLKSTKFAASSAAKCSKQEAKNARSAGEDRRNAGRDLPGSHANSAKLYH